MFSSQRQGRGRRYTSRRWWFPAAIAGLALFVFAGGSPALALSQRGHVFSGSLPGAESGEGKLSGPAGVAVNEASGNIYVVDRGNNRVVEFDHEGKFVSTWGWGVKNGAKEYQVCLAGNSCKAGLPDPGVKEREKFRIGAAEFRSPEGIAIDNSTSAEDPSKGDVYVIADVVPERSVVDKFSATGTFEGKLTTKREQETKEEKERPLSAGRAEGVAVDPAGTVWVAWSEGEITSFPYGGKATLEGLPTPENALPPRPGLAVDSKDDLYLNYEPVEKFGESEEGVLGEEGRSETGGEPCEASPCFVAKTNPAGLESGTTLIAGLDAGRIRAIAADPSNDNVYIANGTRIDAYTSKGALVQQFGSGQLASASGVAVDAATQVVYVTDAATSKLEVYIPEPPARPTVDEAASANITATSVTLRATVDPVGAQTTVSFRYGTSPCSSGGCSEEAKVAGNIGEGFAAQAVSVSVTGLMPGTRYYYEVLSSNGFGVVAGEEHALVTIPSAPESSLPDGRAWELVSPPEPTKNGASFESPTLEGGVIQASEDGQALTYVGTSPDEESPEGNRNPTLTQNLAKRVSTGNGPGWSSKDIATKNGAPQGSNTGHQQEYVMFSPDLTASIVEPQVLAGTPLSSEAPLSPEATEATIYVRNDVACAPAPSTCYQPLVTPASDTASPKAPYAGHLEFGAASPDLSHVAIRSGVPLTGEPTLPQGINDYEWTKATQPSEQLHLLNVGPLGEPLAEPLIGGGNALGTRNAVSRDGSRIFFTAGKGVKHLYMRHIFNRGGAIVRETLQVDAPEPGAEKLASAEEADFAAASSDGSVVYFTDQQRLTPGSTASGEESKRDLYACRITETPEGKAVCHLSDLTNDHNPGETAAVQGSVLETSTDGSFVYFVADGVLSSTANRLNEKASPGSCAASAPPPGATCNLYQVHYSGTAWEAPVFIASLSAEDFPDWELGSAYDLTRHTARSSPNGHYLAFMSDRSLTGYDNRDANPAAEGARDEEVFLYDAEAATLVCASCNPTGARPTGVLDKQEETGEGKGLLVDRPEIWAAAPPAQEHNRWLAGSIPGWTAQSTNGSFYQSRYLSDGGRLFFNSADALVPHDTNGKEDVYEYEPNRLGSCVQQSGCVSLISAGTSSKESAFLDASVSGEDVFFLTASPLASQDIDESLDVYDAHVCTGAAPCVVGASVGSAATCEGATACKPGSTSAPAFATPATSAPGTPPPSLTAPSGKVLASKAAKPTRAQLLARALKSCRKLKSRHRRASCEASAKKRYKAKKASHARRASARHAQRTAR